MALNLNRPVLLDLAANGALTFRTIASGQGPGDSLPVASVNTVEEARQLQVLLCGLSRQDNQTYLLPFPENPEYQDLRAASIYIETMYNILRDEGNPNRKQLLSDTMQHYKTVILRNPALNTL